MEQVGGVLKVMSMPLVSVTDLINKKLLKQEGGATNESSNNTFDQVLAAIATVVFMFLAGYLCWKCNEYSEDKILRFVYTLLAVIFNFFYLIYYFIWHYLTGHAC